MYYTDCPYLIPSKASTGWKKDFDVYKAIDNTLKDSKIQAQVKKALEIREQITKASSFSSLLATLVALSTTTIYFAFVTNIFNIKSYFIHDKGSNTHICNNKSAYLYTKVKKAEINKYLDSGMSNVKVENWKVMETVFESSNSLIPICLENIAFVNSFVTSLVSQSILDSKGVHFNTGGP